MNKLTFYPFDDQGAYVDAYLHEPMLEMETHRAEFPAVVICPGGGYMFLSKREADPVALRYFAAGYNVFILYYSILDHAKNFRPLKELSETFIRIRENAKEWHTDANKIAVCGFSAGGHLAASLGTLWNHKELLKSYDNQEGKNRPNAMILCYPVITADPAFCHQGSIETISGCQLGEDGANFFSLENHVSADTPPAFLWHTVEDDCVPIENSIRMVSALQKQKVSYECHFFPHDGHGTSVCTEEVGSYNPYNARWMDLSIEWLHNTFSYQP
ncbi:alpha/beta hydrolase [Scatolibacter rhodanostii]|uniref:alpha/beta hydrolase n=1 Tax=Scatolibacter rhodanostii TaxID=2014781 RepID=UPI000C086752|nr:alpha/beta hydrolase [Scatolibacter rhodanostii]